MVHVLTQPSTPAAATFESPNQKTELTPPAAAFLMATLRNGFSTLQTYTCVSRDPEAQYLPSDVHARESTRPLWCDHLDVIKLRSFTPYNMIFPLESPAASEAPSGVKAKEVMIPLLFSNTPSSLRAFPSQSYSLTFWSSPPTATTEPEAATALGVNLGFSSNTRWLDRTASTALISATNTVESLVVATAFGCDAVANDASEKLEPSETISFSWSSYPTEKTDPPGAARFQRQG